MTGTEKEQLHVHVCQYASALGRPTMNHTALQQQGGTATFNIALLILLEKQQEAGRNSKAVFCHVFSLEKKSERQMFSAFSINGDLREALFLRCTSQHLRDHLGLARMTAVILCRQKPCCCAISLLQNTMIQLINHIAISNHSLEK